MKVSFNPFIKNNAKCSVYKERPQICREFGTLKDKQNICPEKTSRLDIIKYYIKDFFEAETDFNMLVKYSFFISYIFVLLFT